MTHATRRHEGDLIGTAGERMHQLQRLPHTAHTAEWLQRQLEAALIAWARDETELDIVRESRADY